MKTNNIIKTRSIKQKMYNYLMQLEQLEKALRIKKLEMALKSMQICRTSEF